MKRFAGKLATQLLPTLRWVRRLNGWVQWVTVWLGWLILVIVGRRALMSQRLSRVINAEGFEMVWGDATEADKLLRGCLRELRDIRESIDGNGGSHADKLSLLHAKIDRLRDQLDSDVFTQLGYLLSLLPSLGFIGTVIGMGEALLKADGLFSQSDRQQTISLITKELGFAFDTTLVALVAGIVTGAVITWQRQREHDWLKKIPSYWVSSHSIRAAQTSSGVKAEERTDLLVGDPK